MSIKDTLTAWVTDILESKDPAFFLVNVTVSSGSTQKIVVHLDGDQGIPIDTCAEVSRALSAQLEEQEVVEGPYTLEVSSPGLDQPLQLPRQYVKNVGRTVKVTWGEQQTTTGELLRASDEQIVVQEKPKKKGGKKQAGEEVTITLDQITATKVIPTFK